MSGIARRTVYFDTVGGVVRFWDWCEVKTGLGVMGEPTPVLNWYNSPNDDVIDFDPSDQMVRIDRLEHRSLHKPLFGAPRGQISNGPQNTVGGKMWPRKGA